MKYKKDFADFQKNYVSQYPTALAMRSLLPSNLLDKKVLDIGFGSGIDLDFLKSRNPSFLAGIDASKELTIIAQEKIMDGDIQNGDFHYLPWDKNEFDIIWSKYALQHSQNLESLFQEIYRVLKKGGFAYIQVTHPMRTTEMLSSKNYFDSNFLINYPTIDGGLITEPHHTLQDWFSAILQAGFSVEKVEETLNRPAHEYKGLVTPSSIIFVLKKY